MGFSLKADDETCAKVKVALASFEAMNSREIADFLSEKEIVGFRSEPPKCPIAVYLSVATDRTIVAGSHWAVDQESGLYVTQFPVNVQNFIVDFDAGKYNELLASSDNTTGE